MAFVHQDAVREWVSKGKQVGWGAMSHRAINMLMSALSDIIISNYVRERLYTAFGYILSFLLRQHSRYHATNSTTSLKMIVTLLYFNLMPAIPAGASTSLLERRFLTNFNDFLLLYLEFINTLY